MSEGKEKAVVEIVDLTDMDEDNGKDVQGLYPNTIRLFETLMSSGSSWQNTLTCVPNS